jgi:FMN reductase
MTKKIVAFSGSTRRPSKTAALVRGMADACRTSANVEIAAYDLIDVGLDFAVATSRADLSIRARDILEELESADGLIVGSPVYKGAYSGHFKHFFDLVEPTALQRKPVCLVATGGGQRHALVVEQFLRPLFGFFGALTVPTSVYAGDADFLDYAVSDTGVAHRLAMACEELSSLLRANSK